MTASAFFKSDFRAFSNCPDIAPSSPLRVSRSMRTICCLCATTRVLTLVCRDEFATNPVQPIFCSINNLCSCFAASSLPIAPKSSAGTSSAVRLRATFAAPPGIKLSRSKSTTGTGASGEMRDTPPQMNWSSITSPTTSTRVFVAADKICRTRDADNSFALMLFHL